LCFKLGKTVTDSYEVLKTAFGEQAMGHSQTFQWLSQFNMDVRQTGWDGEDWIDMAEDRDQWRALANTVLNLQVP
jgi:hypothetical protein